MSSNSVVIREAKSQLELHAIEDLQKEIFGFTETEIVGGIELAAFKNNGGIVLIAVDSVENRIIGFVFGFVAIHNGLPCQHSVMLGVLPEYRMRGIGFQLKLEQQRRALLQGIEIIIWYIDPLEGVTSYMSFNKLGGIARKYFCNFYGSSLGHMYAGLDTDRLLVEWQKSSSREFTKVKRPESDFRYLISSGVQIVNTTRVQGKFRKIVDYRLDLLNSSFLVEVPRDI